MGNLGGNERASFYLAIIFKLLVTFKEKRDLEKFQGIWRRFKGFGEVLRDLEKFRGIWSSFEGFGRSFEQFGEVFE